MKEFVFREWGGYFSRRRCTSTLEPYKRYWVGNTVNGIPIFRWNFKMHLETKEVKYE
jgi:hypothetical protein